MKEICIFVDNYDDLASPRSSLTSLQLSRLRADVYSVKDSFLYIHNGSTMDI